MLSAPHTLARTAHRTFAAAALALIGMLTACTDRPTAPTAPQLAGPTLATAPSTITGPVVVTVSGRTQGVLFVNHPEVTTEIPFDSLGHYEFAYEYTMPDPNIAGTWSARFAGPMVVKSFDRNGALLATLASEPNELLVISNDDILGGENRTIPFDMYDAIGEGTRNGVRWRLSLTLTSALGVTDILPGDPARYLSLDAGWDGAVFWTETNVDGTDSSRYHHAASPVTALAVTVRPLVAEVPDADRDGVADSLDKCPATPTGSTVDANGCTPVQALDLAVPCAGPRTGGTWGSHGAYVAAVAAYVDQLLKAGLITEGEKSALVSARARSACGG